MKTRLDISKILFGLFVFLCMPFAAYSTHIVGGALTYVYNGGTSYTFTLKLYRDCGGGAANAPGSISLTILNADGSASGIALTLNPIAGTGQQLPENIDTCALPPTPMPCVEEHVYTGTVNLPPRIGGYHVYESFCCRHADVDNIYVGPTGGNPTIGETFPVFVPQTGIWYENFTLANGTTSDAGSTAWTRTLGTPAPNSAQVNSNRFEFSGANNGTATWTSQVINIAANTSGVYLTAILSQNGGNMENSDSVYVYYSLNGGAQTLFTTNGQLRGNIATTTASTSVLIGNDVQIFVKVKYGGTSPNNEVFRLDDVSVGEVIVNSSPEYAQVPPLFLCNNKPFTYDHSASDPDGDSLVYSFYTPYNDTAPTFIGNVATYNPVTWLSGYSAINPMNSGGTALTLDPATGMLSGTPDSLGGYVVGIKTSEYRNGVLLSEMVRDFQFNIITCYDPAQAFIDSTQKLNAVLNVCNGNAITFPNNTTGSINNFFWDFGNTAATNDTSIAQYPTYTYAGPGTYTVTLITNKGTGCADTSTAVVYVGWVNAAFVASTYTPCLNTSVTFTDSVSTKSANNTITGFSWDFGDGSPPVSGSPVSYTFTTSGTFTVTETTSSSLNCNDTAQRVITVIAEPTASVGISKSDTVCANTPVVPISGFVTDATGIWSSNGTGLFSPDSSINAVSYTLSNLDTAAGTVKLILTATGTGACSSSVVKDSLTIIITPEPTASVGVSKSITICPSNLVVPISGIVSNATGIWSSDGSGIFSPDSTENATSYTLSNADTIIGTVKLVLTATGIGTCNTFNDTDTLTISVGLEPIVSVGAIKTMTVCANSPIVPISGTVINASGIWSSDGSGTFSPDSTTSAINYTLSNADTAAGIVHLVLSATGLGICSTSTDTDTLTITITPEPTASVGVSKSITICSNVSVPLSGTVTNATGIWSSLGSGTFSPDSTENANSYTLSNADTAAGTVDLVLSANGLGGCSTYTGTDTLTVTIMPGPFASVGVSKSISVCSNSPVLIAGTVTNATGLWSTSGSGTFSPDSTENASNYTLSNADTAAGTVQLVLSATGIGGCSTSTDTDTLTVTISPEPTASVGVTKSIGVCANVFVVAISGTVTNAVGVWSTSGTGTFTPDTTISAISYTLSNADTSAGIVKLILSATGSGGCSTFTDTDTLTIITSAPPFVSVGTSNSISVCTNNSNITLNGTVGGAAGGIWTSSGTGTFSPSDTLLNTVYIPSSLDTAQSSIKLFLTSTGNGSCNYVMDSMVVTMLDAPNVNFNSTSVCQNKTTVFSDNSTAITGITSWSWNFGDSNTGTGQNQTHIYTSDGSFSVTLTVTDANSCVTSVTKPATVYPLPVAAFNSTAQCFRDSVFFTDISTISSGSIVAWNWSFGDLTSSTLKNPSHLYPGPASYNSRLIVTSNFGCLDTLSQSLDVKPAPKADFASDSVCLNNATQYTDLSTIDPLAGTIISRNLFFEDNTYQDITLNPTPTHTYSVSGTFNDTLIVIANNGCSDTLIQPVVIHPLPLADYRIDILCLADSTTFTDSSSISSGSIVAWSWDFGDGALGNSKNISHQFAAAGGYAVSLIVTSDKGCKGTTLQLVPISPSPTADFTASPSTVVLHKPIQFTDNSVGSISWQWDFGDTSGTSILQNPSYTYDQRGGTFNVILQVTNTFGCKDTVAKEVIVTLPPKVANGFSPNGDGINDILHVMGGPYKAMEFRILDNWGEYIFISNSQSSGWDGTKNGVKQPIGVYVYTLTVTTEDNEKHVIYGDVTLLR